MLAAVLINKELKCQERKSELTTSGVTDTCIGEGIEDPRKDKEKTMENSVCGFNDSK